MVKFQNRNSSLDIVRIIAFCSVVSVHFFLNTEFYNTPIDKPIYHLMIIPRTFSLVCVPLFIILSGYLMNKKTLSKEYYRGIIKTLSIYILASIPCYFHNLYFTGSTGSFKGFIFGILGFYSAKYSWYIEMYIGLFLLIPFLNLIYNNLKSQKQKQALIITLIVLTILPSVLNTYNLFDINWWQAPAYSNNYNKILPNYWENFYPVTYYFIGAFLNEFKIKIKPIKCAFAYLIIGLIFSIYCMYRSNNHVFISGEWQLWNGFPVMIMSVLLFILISNINSQKINLHIKKLLFTMSNLTLGAYLVSSLCDDLIYNFLSKVITNDLEKQFYYFPICVLSVIILSYLFSFMLNIIYELMQTLIIKLTELKKLK